MISRLSLTDFRSYADAVVEPGPGLVILTGENGAGKTNLLEAVSMLAPGRGLRGAPLSDMARQDGAGGFTVAARLDDGVDIGCGTLPSAAERRVVRINGVAAAANALAERIAVLWLTPAMDRLFTDSAGARRRFLDRLVLALEPTHAHHAARYEAAMRARTRLLTGDAAADPSWLSALEAQMQEHGAALAQARTRTVQALRARIEAAPESLFARAGISLEGTDAGPWPFAANRSRDGAAGRATEGPHRQDLIVMHLAKGQAAALCSTGEQKALLIGLILAHAELVAERAGQPPVLLLDEVAAHLDPGRRAALIDRLVVQGGQVWMTGTEPELFAAAPSHATRYVVAQGQVVSD
ncbi:DNA replication/repair protein RecF [Sphingomonas sp. ID1715]|uniref:DNA replication/repair protein RecF n=1 Tax=Sphingomonas sp. ID1715 TaxID=1656898 RepID=UPI001488ED0A|nr:DNA replication/repair protein RecF [Sphingomonas sp. ID1715]